MRNKLIYVCAALLLLSAVVPLAVVAGGQGEASGSGGPAVEAAVEDIESVDSEMLARLIEEKDRDYILVDVRTEAEYEAGYIPTAVNIPHTEIEQNPPTDDRSAFIIVYCRSGGRSGIAKDTLESMGYENVVNFGGIGSWEGELVRPE